MRRGTGDPQIGVVLRDHSLLDVCVCVHSGMYKCVCAGIKSIMPVFFPLPLSLSLVLLMNNDLIVDCGVKCQLSVCLYVTCVILTGAFFPPSIRYFYEGVYVFSRCGSSPQQEPLRKLTDQSHFSSCAADVHSIRPKYCRYHCNDG